MKIKEEDIRPEKIFNEYLRLTEIDTQKYFSISPREDICCPSCLGEGELWVEKQGFEYKICLECKTIYVSPRPNVNAFNEYYTSAASTEYWATTFYKYTEQARRNKLWKPKAQMIKDRIIKFQNTHQFEYIVDIGGGYGIFVEEINKIIDIKTIVIEPSSHLAEICRSKNINVIEKFMEDIDETDLPKGRKCFVSFELFEHLHNPTTFLEVVNKNMNIGDMFILTTLSGMGLDIQTLGQNSKSLSPPHHLNFFNPKSISKLLQKNGFDVIEAITPGKLDVDIIQKQRANLKDVFWKNTIDYLNEDELENLQNTIATLGLSSHMMITSIKNNNV
jgi:2-polyprenyl-3-methyl-5-hydroxy-6-metoxy-1,4-benzoquinol methylase